MIEGGGGEQGRRRRRIWNSPDGGSRGGRLEKETDERLRNETDALLHLAGGEGAYAVHDDGFGAEHDLHQA